MTVVDFFFLALLKTKQSYAADGKNENIHIFWDAIVNL